LIQIELSISATGKGLLETSGLEGDRERTGVPAPTGNVVTEERRVHGSAIVMMNVLRSLQKSIRSLLHFLS
jgi:hypothetical protein